MSVKLPGDTETKRQNGDELWDDEGCRRRSKKEHLEELEELEGPREEAGVVGTQA